MALDSNGYLHAAWYTGGRSNAEGPGLYYAVSKDDAETWSYPLKVWGETFFPPAHIKITAVSYTHLTLPTILLV